ncbi:MAG: hypothetical protein OD816_001134 [Thermodesulfobacterium sp.]|uniref:ATP synthase I chain n=1 Tax=Candidatus Thermodesulfobacterium syntrophicum TaxID=3060442 RepID=A0AAE3TEE8_9BACT|nr:hypothetical protein [Candidatus Thermodesulfobacterium syntrophicum]
MRKISSENFIKNLEISIIIFSAISIILSFLILKNLNYVFSLLSGIIVAYLNFRSTKNESIKIVNSIKQGLSPQKGTLIYMSKFYLRLLATGIVLYFLIKILRLNSILILIGLIFVHFQLILIPLKDLHFKKLEII